MCIGNVTEPNLNSHNYIDSVTHNEKDHVNDFAPFCVRGERGDGIAATSAQSSRNGPCSWSMPNVFQFAIGATTLAAS